MLSQGQRSSPVLIPSKRFFDASSVVRLHASLSSTHYLINATPFDHNVHLRGH